MLFIEGVAHLHIKFFNIKIFKFYIPIMMGFILNFIYLIWVSLAELI